MQTDSNRYILQFSGEDRTEFSEESRGKCLKVSDSSFPGIEWGQRMKKNPKNLKS